MEKALMFMFLNLLKPALIVACSLSFGLNKSAHKHSGPKAKINKSVLKI